MDMDKAAALARRALGWFALAGTMYLLCRALPSGVPAPFAMALLAAGLLAGKNVAALLAGCVAGAVRGSIQSFDLRLPIGAAVVLGGNLLWDQFAERIAGGLHAMRRRKGQGAVSGGKARSPTRAEQVRCSTLSGAGVLIPGQLCAGDAIWPSAIQTVVAAVAAVASGPFFEAALAVGWKRRWLDREEKIGLCLLLATLTAGLGRICMPLALWACGALALLIYPCGRIAIGGAAAQLGGELPRQGRAAGACGAMLTAGLLLNVPPGMLAGVGASALAAMALPEAWADAIALLARPIPEAGDPQQLADRARRQSVRRLRALGAAFGELAEGYATTVSLPDEQALMGRLRTRLCDGCPGYEACWSGERDGGARFLCDLIARAVALSGEAPLFDGEVTPDIMRRCRRGRLIPERIQDLLEDFARTRRSELKRGSENRLISAQFAQARELLDGLADRQDEPMRLSQRLAERAAAALERVGIEADSVLTAGGRHGDVIAGLRRGRWTPELARLASSQLARALGRVYVPSSSMGRTLCFSCRPRLGVQTGAACVSREAGTPSGDCHVICMLDEERLLALICDGMGSGAEAARESGLAVRLLGRFLKAGAEPELAIETVNALLLNRGGEDMFATVDMLILNLSTGEALFIKLAACPTLIVRGGTLQRVEGGRLPLGILEKVQPSQMWTRLMPGDVLLMGSDGVMDAVGCAALEALLLEQTGDMPALAHRVMTEAEAACDGGRRDDMTAICLRLGIRRGARN